MAENTLRNRRVRVTFSQLENLWEFLAQHPEIAVGYNKSVQAREYSKRNWNTIAAILNSAGEGAYKTGAEWSKYWVDLKAKLRRKNRALKDARNRTGGGPSDVQELSEIEMKFLTLLGDDYGSGLPGVQVIPNVIQEQEIPINTQPTSSGEQSGEIWLDVALTDSENTCTIGLNTIEVPEEQPAQILNTIPITSLQSAAATPLPPLSTPQEPISPNNFSQHSASHNPRVNVTRRRVLPRQRLSAAEARDQLVLVSHRRAEAELANSHAIQQAVTVLSEITNVLRRIEARLSGEGPTGE